MKTIDRYIVRRHLSTFLMAAIAFVGLFVVIDYVTRIRFDAIELNVSPPDILAYYAFLLPRVLNDYQITAVAVLIATLLLFGGMAQRHETTALFAGGISLRRAVIGPACVGLLTSIALFVMSDTVGTYTAREVSRMEIDVFGQREEETLPGISWAGLSDGWTCHIAEFDRGALSGTGVLLLRRELEDVPAQLIRAATIHWDSASTSWVLETGTAATFFPEGVDIEAFDRHEAPIAETPEGLFAITEDTRFRNLHELAIVIERAESRSMPTRTARVDWHGKTAKPMLPFVMVWLAIPFAMRLRRGGFAVSFGASIALGLSYLIVSTVAQGLGYAGHVPPVAAAWAPNCLFLGAGLALFFRTPT